MLRKIVTYNVALAFALAATPKGFAQVTARDIIDAHPCKVHDKSGDRDIDAVCGKKFDKDGILRPFRTFTNPHDGNIMEQYKISDSEIREVELRVNPDGRSAIFMHNVQQSSDSTSKWLIVGGAVVSVAAIAVGARMLYKRGQRNEAARARERDEHYRRGYEKGQSTRPEVLRDMPNKIKLGPDVPGGAGQTASVAGAVPSSSVPKDVPRFTSSNGDTYIVQQNPDTHMLETLLLYNMLSRPYYYPGAYMYPPTYAYSPFVYGGGGDVIVNNTIIEDPGSMRFEEHDYSSNSSDVHSFADSSSPDVTVMSDRTESPADSNFGDAGGSFDSGSNSAPDNSTPSTDTGSSWGSSSDSGSSSSDSGSSSWGSSSDSGGSFDSGSSGSFDSGSSGSFDSGGSW